MAGGKTPKLSRGDAGGGQSVPQRCVRPPPGDEVCSGIRGDEPHTRPAPEAFEDIYQNHIRRDDQKKRCGDAKEGSFVGVPAHAQDEQNRQRGAGQSHSGDRQRGNVHVFSRKREKPASAGGNQAASAGGKKRPERIGSLLLGGGKKHGSRGHDAQRGRVFPETGKKCAESVSGMIQQSGDRRIEERADEHQDQKEAECRQKTGAFFT